jgi:hypothetical protein
MEVADRESPRVYPRLPARVGADVLVTNRAEGNAPFTVEALVGMLRD